MTGSTGRVRAFACGSPVDMRKGFDGLFALVRRELRRDPLSGDLFLFVNKTRKRAKVLLWDGTGLCIYRGHSRWLRPGPGGAKKRPIGSRGGDGIARRHSIR